MRNQKTVSFENIKPSAAETADGASTVQFVTRTARTLEIWVKVTAVSGTSPTLDIDVETKLNDETGFDVQKSFTQITSAGSFSVVLNWADHALGTETRINWSLGGTTPNFTFEAFALRYE